MYSSEGRHPQSSEEGLDPWELELQALVSYPTTDAAT